MILKEAFRYQNFLNCLLTDALGLLGNHSPYIFITKQEHKRSLANPEAQNEEIITTVRDKDITANELLNFLEVIMEEKKKITYAISNKKMELAKDFNVDAELELNKFRSKIYNSLGSINSVKSREVEIYGTDFKFNINNEQVPYKYPIKEVTTIDFDRNKSRRLYKSIKDICDTTSHEVDRFDVCVEINFVPKFTLDDSLEDIIHDLRESK